MIRFAMKVSSCLSFGVLLAGGCAALPMAAVGTAVGIAGTAVSTGSDVYSAGKLDSAEAASLEDVRRAIFLGADDLGLQARFEKLNVSDRLIRFDDGRGSIIDVKIDQRTPKLMRLRINVGAWGDEPTARLFLRVTREHLHAESDPG